MRALLTWSGRERSSHGGILSVPRTRLAIFMPASFVRPSTDRPADHFCGHHPSPVFSFLHPQRFRFDYTFPAFGLSCGRLCRARLQPLKFSISRWVPKGCKKCLASGVLRSKFQDGARKSSSLFAGLPGRRQSSEVPALPSAAQALPSIVLVYELPSSCPQVAPA